MTKEEMKHVEDAIVSAIEDQDMTKEEMLQYVTSQYKASPIMVMKMYEEMYSD